MKKLLYYVLIIFGIMMLSANAAMLVPDVYISGGYNISDSSLKYYDQDSITKQSYSDTANQYQFAIGIRPLDIPIFGGFRVEGEYSLPASSDIENNDLGVVLFYDFRILPIITPYVGIGYHRTKYSFNVPNLSTTDDSNNAYSFHAGADFAIPIVGLSIFADYEYEKTTTRAKDNNTESYGVKDHSLIVGLKYYLLQ